MSDCPRCGFPMAWSVDHKALRCSVYGTHPDESVGLPCQCYTCVAQRERDARRAPRLRVVA